jgi:hypothetical protein
MGSGLVSGDDGMVGRRHCSSSFLVHCSITGDGLSPGRCGKGKKRHMGCQGSHRTIPLVLRPLESVTGAVVPSGGVIEAAHLPITDLVHAPSTLSAFSRNRPMDEEDALQPSLCTSSSSATRQPGCCCAITRSAHHCNASLQCFVGDKYRRLLDIHIGRKIKSPVTAEVQDVGEAAQTPAR